MTSVIESLQSHLSHLSNLIGAQSLSPSSPSARLVRISHTHLALLHTFASSSHVYILSTIQQPGREVNRPKAILVPSDAHSLTHANGFLAVIGSRSVTIIDRPLSPSTSTCAVAASLFSRRPNLTLIHAAWAPHTSGFLLLLTSDCTLRLYDVISSDVERAERLCLRIVATAAPPVCFTFGCGREWASLSVYLLLSDGSIFVVAPIAPIGTQLPYPTWKKMLSDAQARVPETDTPGTSTSWTVRQNEMKIRFLNQVFDRSSSGDMVAVRQFNPAPLLFQGPLFIEHDDISQASKLSFTSLISLNYRTDGPLVLLRVSNLGHVSVLIALETLEPQWYLGTDSSLSPDTPVEASEEYGTCAAQVAPSLLCFEHIEFDNSGLTLFPVGAASHSDVIIASSSTAVHAARLPFIAALNYPQALERCPPSFVVRILTTTHATSREMVKDLTTKLGGQFRRNSEKLGNVATTKHVIGIAPQYVRGFGTVAIALTSDGSFHISTPIRWGSPVTEVASSSVLSGRLISDQVWSEIKRPERTDELNRPLSETSGSANFGKDTRHLLESVQSTEDRIGGKVGKGTLGVVNQLSEFEPVLEELERRVEVYTGSGETSGLSARLGEIANTIIQWGSALSDRAVEVGDECVTLADDVHKLIASEQEVQRKVSRVNELGILLEERIKTLKELINDSDSSLSPVELARRDELRERKRRVLFLKGRTEELAATVSAFRRERDETRSSYETPDRSLFSPERGSGRRATTDAFPMRHESGGPLSRKRAGWSRQSLSTSLPAKDVDRIREALEKHSCEIEKATNLDMSLRKKLFVK